MLQFMGSQRVRYEFIMQRRDTENTHVINRSRDWSNAFYMPSNTKDCRQQLGDKCGKHSLSESKKTNFENTLLSEL